MQKVILKGVNIILHTTTFLVFLFKDAVVRLFLLEDTNDISLDFGTFVQRVLLFFVGIGDS